MSRFRFPSRGVLTPTATFAVLLATYLVGVFSFEHFGSAAVLRNLLVDNAFLGVAAAGTTVVIISGGIDLSVGSLMALSAVVVSALVGRYGWHPAPAMLVALGGGAAFGAAQGGLIRVLALPAFIVTLAGLFLARGLAFAIQAQSAAVDHPFIARTLGETLALELPLGPRGMSLPPTVPALLLVFAATWWLLRRTPFGRRVHAIGDDAEAAALMGVPVAATGVRVYALSGFLSALAGLFFLLYQQSGDPASCRGLELDAIAAVVIGGTLLRGGVGSVVGTFFGVMTLGLIQTLITFQGDLNSWWTRIAVGALMLAFLLGHAALDRLAERARRAA
ncbi:MAG: sugar ABC transporter permease YjfF [Planctomycetota bacterium]